MDDRFDLARFVTAQEPVFETMLAELRRGRKASHWMWFVFPQLAGLGTSPTTRFYALADLTEARAYLDHAVLGERLRQAIDALRAAPGDDPVAILGSIDAVKLRSSMTLFEAAGDDDRPAAVLARFFGGVRDPATLALLRR